MRLGHRPRGEAWRGKDGGREGAGPSRPVPRWGRAGRCGGPRSRAAVPSPGPSLHAGLQGPLPPPLRPARQQRGRTPAA